MAAVELSVIRDVLIILYVVFALPISIYKVALTKKDKNDGR